MPRPLRDCPGGLIYHVLNRANGRITLFRTERDYLAFEAILLDAVRRFGMRLLAYVIMPNHFHLVLWPRRDGDLSRFMHWLTVTHVGRWHAHHGTAGTGHLYQGRFKSFPVEADEHLIVVWRYVERNAIRANLARHARNWRWSSLAVRLGLAGAHTAKLRQMLAEGPIDLPRDWEAFVNAPQTDAEVRALRESFLRGRPFGTEAWSRRTATRLGLQPTLRPRGRPRTNAPTMREAKKGS
jgi:putative transposase